MKKMERLARKLLMNNKHAALERAIAITIESYKNGGKLLVCGNGGSAADSGHIVGELVKGFLKKRPLPANWDETMDHLPLQMGLPAIDLTAQGAVISAITNDLGGDMVYAQQVMAYANPGDVIIGLSTSGNARNVILALRAAKMKGAHCIGLTGLGGGKMKDYCDVLIESAETKTYRVQEEHIRTYHEFCARVEAAFFEE